MQWASPGAVSPLVLLSWKWPTWEPQECVPNHSHFLTELLHPVTHQVLLIPIPKYLLGPFPAFNFLVIDLSQSLIISYLDNQKSIFAGFLPKNLAHLS